MQSVKIKQSGFLQLQHLFSRCSCWSCSHSLAWAWAEADCCIKVPAAEDSAVHCTGAAGACTGWYSPQLSQAGYTGLRSTCSASWQQQKWAMLIPCATGSSFWIFDLFPRKRLSLVKAHSKQLQLFWFVIFTVEPMPEQPVRRDHTGTAPVRPQGCQNMEEPN